MKLPVRFLIFSSLIAIGVYLGSALVSRQRAAVDETIPNGENTTQQSHLSSRSISQEQPSSILPVEYPKGAIEDELVIHFASRDDYFEYLKALRAAGIAPLDQIDELLVVRVGRDAMTAESPHLYGGREQFSYRVEQPLPPVEVAPQLMAQLRAFGMPATAIVGGLVEGDGSGVIVAVLDSGLSDHPQFDAVDIASLDLTGASLGGPGAEHGTAVASIIGGRTGIAPASELLIIRVLDRDGVGSAFDVAKGIVTAVDEGARVLNLSLGMYQDTSVLHDAVRYAADHDVIMVAAAGNDGYTQIAYPAAYPEVLSVTAVDAAGRQAVFPNQSDLIDFAAPGVGILTAKEDEGTMLFTGTSAAAPFVSGTLAAMLSADPALSSTEAVHRMQRYLDDAGAPGVDSVYGAGLVNWDRLRERNTSDVLDVALADIYLQADARPGTTMPVEVIVQNRGTTWLSASTLTVVVGEDEPIDFTVGTLGPGQTTTRTIYTPVPALNSDEPLHLAAQILPEEPLSDVRFENNTKAVYFRPIQK
jgi:subtilisin family serine protease